MKKILKTLICLYMSVMLVVSSVFVASAAEDKPLTSREDFMWGVNMHEDFYNVYANNVDEMMHLAAEMGVKIIRTAPGSQDWTDKVVRLANKYGMKVMLTIGNVVARGVTTEAFNATYDFDYQYAYAKMLANRYNGKNGYGKVDFFILDNEVDNALGELANKQGVSFSDGSTKDQYVRFDVESVATKMKNYIAAIKAADTDAKTVVIHGWLHYGFLDWLEDFNVEYDMISLHWYTDMSSWFVREGKRPAQQLEFLYERYGKEMFITETNHWSNTERDDEDVSNWDGFVELLEDAYKYPYLKGVTVYEFFDETYMEEVDGPYFREAHFGMVYADRYGAIIGPKPIYYRLKNLWGGKTVKKLNYTVVTKEFENSISKQDEVGGKNSVNNNSSNKNNVNSDKNNSSINNAGSITDNNTTWSYIEPPVESTSEFEVQDPVDSSVADTTTSDNTTVIDKKTKSAKFVWTVENTVTVIIGVACLLLLSCCIAFIIIRNKQIKALIR